MRPEVMITQPLTKSCIAALNERYTVHNLVDAADPEALIADVGPRLRAVAGGKVSSAMMEKLPKLEIIANSGVGYDSIDTVAAKARGIRVTNTPDVLNDAVAELTLGLMIALARQIPKADSFVRNGQWLKGQYPNCGQLAGKTMGILGLGRIGKEIASRAFAMKMKVVYSGRTRQPDQPYDYYDSLVEMARAVDWLVVIMPGGPGTSKIISREVLEALGPDGILVNMARGSLVDEAALVEMLVSGQLGGAVLDVFEKEPQVPEALMQLQNVILSPHQGSKTQETRDAMGAMLVANLEAHFAGKPLISPVV